MHKALPLGIVFVLGIAAPAGAGEPPIRIDDFEDLDLEAATGLSWMTIGDWLMGGASTGDIAAVRLPPGSRSRGALRLTGHLRKGASFPFAGVWTALREDGVPRDLTGYRGMRFRARGTPGSYLVGVRRTDGKSSANLMAPVTVTSDWTDVEVGFGELQQLPKSASAMTFAASGVAWIGFTSGRDTPRDFQLEIDDVGLVPEPSASDAAAPWTVRKLRLTDARALDRVSFVTVGREGGGDTVSARLPDARELQLGVAADGRVWFRFVLHEPPPASYFGLNVALDIDGDPDNGAAWWGLNKRFHYDRLLTAYLSRGAGYWQGASGVADAAQIAKGRFAGVSGDVRVAVDPARRVLAIGVLRSALGLAPGGRVRLIGTVGSNMTFNDDIPDEGAFEVVVPDPPASGSVSH